MAKKRERAVVIGVGGIGKFLLTSLPRFMAFDDDREWELVLVDGDEYEVKNAKRQKFKRLGNKAEVTAEEIREDLPELLITVVSAFVASEKSTVHEDHARLVVPIDQVIQENDWVFLCVDNHATRKLVSDYIQSLKNVRLISGGNDETDGNIQIVIRRNGNNLFPALDHYHSEIANPSDKPPYAMSCELLAQAGKPQIIFANQMAATLMAASFWSELNRKLKAEEIYFDLSATLGQATGPGAAPQLRKKK